MSGKLWEAIYGSDRPVAKRLKKGGAGVPPAQVDQRQPGRSPHRYPEPPERIFTVSPLDGLVMRERNELTAEPQRAQSEGETSAASAPQRLSTVYSDPAHGIWLYHGNSLTILDAIAAKHPDGCFEMVFADPPYFLSNGATPTGDARTFWAGNKSRHRLIVTAIGEYS